MLRLGFDAKRVFNNFTGLGNYSRTLLRNLSYYYPDFGYFLYTPTVIRNSETKIFLNSPLFSLHHPSNIQRPFWQSFYLDQSLAKHKIDLFHGLANELPSALENTPIVKVVTIHDLAYKKHPEFLSLGTRLNLERRVGYAIRQADHIVVPSESTKQDLLAYFQVKPEHISVIYQTCSERFLQEKSEALLNEISIKYALPDQYMLYVGAITPRKNLLSVLEAMTLLPDSYRIPLVIVGNGRTYLKKVIRYAQRNGLQKYLQFVRPAFEDLPAIFQNADIFVYPSRYEGFGIPVLEALFSKTPVLTSHASSLPEVAGPGAHLIDPTEPEDISQGIQSLLSDMSYQNHLVEAGYAYAQQFRGEPVSEHMVDLYRALLGADDLEGADL